MASTRRRPFPDAPDLPPALDPAPPTLRSHDTWEGVLAGAEVEVEDWVADVVLRECRWERGVLAQRRFTGLVARDVEFTGCDLGGVAFPDAELTRVRFESCRVTGASFAGARLQDVHFVDCGLDLAELRMATVRRSAAESSVLRESDWYSATLDSLRLTGCDLGGAGFEVARAENVDPRGSTLDGLRGSRSLAGALIDADQVIVLGALLLGEFGFRVE